MTSYTYEKPPIYVNARGVRYVNPSELVQSRAFWRAVEKTSALMRKIRGEK